MSAPINRYLWYPPAESWQPFMGIAQALFPGSANLHAALLEYTRATYVITANNAKSLLYMLLKHLHGKSGHDRDTVLIPGYTCYTVAAAVAKAGLRIQVYDQHVDSLRADMESLKEAIDDRTLAVISQHLFGIVSPVNEIQAIAETAGIYHIEDAAQAFGCRCEDRAIGTTGHYGLFSFGRGKALAVGGGGALISNDEGIIEFEPRRPSGNIKPAIMSLITRIAGSRLLYGIAESLPLGLGETVFDPSFEPAAMPIFYINLAVETLHRLEHDIAHRYAIATLYRGVLEGRQIPLESNCWHNVTRYPVLASDSPIPPSLYRLGVRRMYPQAISSVPKIKPYLADNLMLSPGSHSIAERLITLPTHRAINEAMAQILSKLINETYSPSFE